MKFVNYWLLRAKERGLIKITEWAQKHEKKVRELTLEEVREALRSNKPI